MEVKAFTTPSCGEVALLKSISHFVSLKLHEHISKLIFITEDVVHGWCQ